MENLQRLAIIGASGLLGTKLVEYALQDPGLQIYAFAHAHVPSLDRLSGAQIAWMNIDVRSAYEVDRALHLVRPTAVINAAALADVDKCEIMRDDAWAINAAGPCHLAEACVSLGAYFLQVSTDYVFPGTTDSPGPYLEGAQVNPVNWYGQTKLEGEQAVRKICEGNIPWLIVRTAVVYGSAPAGRLSFVAWLYQELRAGHRVRVVNDQLNTPTSVDDLASSLLYLLKRKCVGIVHLAGPDLLRRDVWAQEIAAYYGLDSTLIDVISTAELRQHANRPLYSGLRSSREDVWHNLTFRDVRSGLRTLPLLRM